MIKTIEEYAILFFIYSFAGWLMESLRSTRREGRFINRGFLIGPICPIYGWGVLLITILLKKYTDDFIATFCMAVLICGVLEYMTSYVMEKIFNARWWDYSDRKFNINGRVCLETLIPFGILGVIIIYITNPFLLKHIISIPDIISHIIVGILVIIYIIDSMVSLFIIFNLKKIKKELKDNTIEISEKVKDIILKKSKLHRRLVNAFPKIKESVKFNKWESIKEKIEHIKHSKNDNNEKVTRNLEK